MFSNTEIYSFPQLNLVGDPLALNRKLYIATQGQLRELVIQYNEGETDLDKAKAEEALVAATRTAFGLAPVSRNGGVGDAAVLSLLSHFLEWLSTPVDKPTKPSLIGSGCTDCPQTP